MDIEGRSLSETGGQTNTAAPYVKYEDDNASVVASTTPSFIHDWIVTAHFLSIPFAKLFQGLGAAANSLGICLLRCRCRGVWILIYSLSILFLLFWWPFWLVNIMVSFLITAVQCRCFARWYDQEPLPSDTEILQRNLMLPHVIMVDVAELMGM